MKTPGSFRKCAHLLILFLPEAAERILVVADENAAAQDYGSLRGRDLTIVTNRINVARDFEALGGSVILNDFDFSELATESFDLVLFRTAKEKTVTHHVINGVFPLLEKAGRLLLAGRNQEGIKTYAKKAGDLYGSKPQVLEITKGARCIAIARNRDELGGELPTEDYANLRPIQIDNLAFYSKPGIYGWKKIDVGSSLLISSLEYLDGKRVLDFGCGYGYLSIMAQRLGAEQVTAFDNNVAAVTATRTNFEHFGIPGEVVLSDAGEGIDDCFDIVVCNPPYHVGFARSAELRRKFLQQMSRLVADPGAAYIVVDRKMPYHEWAAEYFGAVSQVGAGHEFKVLRMVR